MKDVESKGFVSDDFRRVAVVDDVFFGPNRKTVESELSQFCAQVDANNASSEILLELTGNAFTRPEEVDNDAINRLFQKRGELQALTEDLELLFLSHDQRLSDVEKIVSLLEEMDFTPTRFSSAEGLFEGDPFNLILLDYYLRDEGESGQIAQEIATKFRAFIILMSDKPHPGEFDAIEESFRRRSRLLKGFFSFAHKSELKDMARLEKRLNALPKNARVCQSVQSFVDAIDLALGGPLLEPEEVENQQGSMLLNEFAKTIRSLALHDYAMLCELTLRGDGHPLGDYVVRLLGAFLMQKLLENEDVRSAVQVLDEMRFDEFLPFAGEATESLKEIYAASIFETIASPWSYHPWEESEVQGEASEDKHENA